MPGMTFEDFEIGQRVRHKDGTLGRVVDKNYGAVKIEWDDGQTSLHTERGRLEQAGIERVEHA